MKQVVGEEGSTAAAPGTSPGTSNTASASTATVLAGDTGGVDGLMGEISSLLKAMKVGPTLRALVSRTSTTEEGVLLDSGAAHNLRKTYGEQEWNEAVEIEVQTAVGTAKLRQSQDFSIFLTKAEETQPIRALGLGRGKIEGDVAKRCERQLSLPG